ncbi:MAG: aminotransferase class I/II-fold pyridoxal phosphate-dependent enzyme [Planctomycetales bacterium]|nr:aminotransferase class I/II-fold pyridoxal phosphate-dependent enzyme [Planctomycetales bacterium]
MKETRSPKQSTVPFSPPIYLASVYACESPEQARDLLEHPEHGYVYQRDAHPNADQFAEACGDLHHAPWSVVTASGMSAIAAALLTSTQQGDHVLVSDQLYGRTLQLFVTEAARYGVVADAVDTSDLESVRRALRPETRLVVVETISNPLLRVADIAQLADLTHQHGAELLVDNTFATGRICQPLRLGADWVVESVSKIMNGHSDVMLGMLCGPADQKARARDVVSVWGLASSAFDCWLALRGLATLHLRLDRACQNAQQVAEFLQSQPGVNHVRYPGLTSHPDHALASRQFMDQFGWMVTFDCLGGADAATRFIHRIREKVPFCPSLGEVQTTLSHPASTSHRRHSEEALERLGISAGTIRLSVGADLLLPLLEALENSL